MTEQHGKDVLDERAFEQLREMVGDDPEFIAEFIGTFLRNAPRQIQEIREGLAAGDAGRVRMAAHTLKSNSADMGARRLSEVARRFEHAGRDGDLAGLDELLTELETAFAEASTALEARRGN